MDISRYGSGIFTSHTPMDRFLRLYDAKFAAFLKRCREAESSGVPVIVISAPEELGDTKDEILESLRRICRHGLLLEITDEDYTY